MTDAAPSANGERPGVPVTALPRSTDVLPLTAAVPRSMIDSIHTLLASPGCQPVMNALAHLYTETLGFDPDKVDVSIMLSGTITITALPAVPQEATP